MKFRRFFLWIIRCDGRRLFPKKHTYSISPHAQAVNANLPTEKSSGAGKNAGRGCNAIHADIVAFFGKHADNLLVKAEPCKRQCTVMGKGFHAKGIEIPVVIAFAVSKPSAMIRKRDSRNNDQYLFLSDRWPVKQTARLHMRFKDSERTCFKLGKEIFMAGTSANKIERQIMSLLYAAGKRNAFELSKRCACYPEWVEFPVRRHIGKHEMGFHKSGRFYERNRSLVGSECPLLRTNLFQSSCHVCTDIRLSLNHGINLAYPPFYLNSTPERAFGGQPSTLPHTVAFFDRIRFWTAGHGSKDSFKAETRGAYVSSAPMLSVQVNSMHYGGHTLCLILSQQE